jgi:hypothetical protein
MSTATRLHEFRAKFDALASRYRLCVYHEWSPRQARVGPNCTA